MNLYKFNKMIGDSFKEELFDSKTKERVFLIHCHTVGDLRNTTYYFIPCSLNDLNYVKDYVGGYRLSIQEAYGRIKPIVRWLYEN